MKAITIYHYKQSVKREIQVVLILLTILLSMPSILTSASVSHKPVSRDDLLRLAAKHYPDTRLISAVISVESNWNPRAVSSKGAIGLGQIMPESGRIYAGLSRSQLFEPDKNIIAICKIMSMYRRINPDLQSALNDYSGGGGKRYYEKVMRAYKG